MANASGGTVMLGVDRGGAVSGLKDPAQAHEFAMRACLLCNPPLMLPLPEILELDGHSLMLLSVPKGLPHVYNLRGKYLIRDGDRNVPLGARRLRQLLLERGESGFDSHVLENTEPSDLDERKIRSYLNAIEAFAGANATDALMQRGCLRKANGEVRPTVAGLLMFGRDPGRHLPQSGMLLAHYAGTRCRTTSRRKRFTIPFRSRSAAPKTLSSRTCARASRLNRLEREEKTEYPRAAIREVIVNAVAHRDYSIRGDEIRIAMFADRIEVYSPGRLPGHVTVKISWTSALAGTISSCSCWVTSGTSSASATALTACWGS